MLAFKFFLVYLVIINECLLFTVKYMTLYVLFNAQGFPEHLDDFWTEIG